MAENCSAHNLSISIDEALPPGCVDGCCCPAYNSTCVCKLDPFYICKNGSHLISGEPCNCPTKLCICIRKATIEINNTHLYYEQQQSCCQRNAGCTTVGEVRRVIVGGKMQQNYGTLNIHTAIRPYFCIQSALIYCYC